MGVWFRYWVLNEAASSRVFNPGEKSASAMGLSDAFDGIADFSRIDGTNVPWLTSVEHRTFVEAIEEGIMAAAATASHAERRRRAGRFMSP